MPYFPVDDEFAFHRKAVAAGNAAIGLWTRAGSWSKHEGTGGLISNELAAAMGSRKEIRRLVDVGLWVEVLGGFQFHDWTDYGANESADVEEQRRDEKRAGWRERKARQREKEKEEAERDMRDGHGVTGGVTGGGSHEVGPGGSHGGGPSHARARPLSKSQEPTLRADQSVPHTRDGARTDEVLPPIEVEFLERALALRVDFRRVRQQLVEQAEELVPDAVVMRVIDDSLRRAKPRNGDRTGLVLTSLERDWHEWSQLVYLEAAAS